MGFSFGKSNKAVQEVEMTTDERQVRVCFLRRITAVIKQEVSEKLTEEIPVVNDFTVSEKC